MKSTVQPRKGETNTHLIARAIASALHKEGPPPTVRLRYMPTTPAVSREIERQLARCRRRDARRNAKARAAA